MVSPSLEQYGSKNNEYMYNVLKFMLHDSTRHTRTLSLLLDTSKRSAGRLTSRLVLLGLPSRSLIGTRECALGKRA
jgi:hypothetical protein